MGRFSVSIALKAETMTLTSLVVRPSSSTYPWVLEDIFEYACVGSLKLSGCSLLVVRGGCCLS